MSSALKFRNITASPEDPVETWPFEGVLAAVERGTVPNWRRLTQAIKADPWGPVAAQVLEAVRLSRPYGTTELLEGATARRGNWPPIRSAPKWPPRCGKPEPNAPIAARIRRANRGTSRTRLSTYMSGRVIPSAALMVRMRLEAGLASGPVAEDATSAR